MSDLVVQGKLFLRPAGQAAGAANVNAVTVVTPGDASHNEVVKIAIDADEGTFKLTFSASESSVLNPGSTAAAVQSALEGTSGIAPGDVVVTKGDRFWTVEFTGTLALTNVGAITVTSATTLKSNGAFTDVSCDVTSTVFKPSRATVDIPATLCADSSSAAGAKTYELAVGYLADTADSTLFDVLFDCALSSSKALDYRVTLHDGAADPDTNPERTGTVISSGAEFSGDAGGLLTGSVTLFCTDRPTITDEA